MLTLEQITASLTDLDDEDLDALAEAVEEEQDDRDEGNDMPDDLLADGDEEEEETDL